MRVKFWGVVEALAQESKDPKRKVGAILINTDNDIISTGYNGFPRGIKDDDRLIDPATKLKYVMHAEQNTISNAARVGVSTKGTIMLVNLFPCVQCAKAIIQAGITAVYAPNTPANEPFSKWAAGAEESIMLLEEAGVKVFFVDRGHYDQVLQGL